MADPFLGEIRMFGGNFAPLGWAFCDGRLLPIAQYDALFAILGTIYGGDGQQTFALPDLRGRLPMAAGSGPGLTPRALGERGGAESHALTPAELPLHRHGAPASTQAATTPAPTGGAVPAAGRAARFAPTGDFDPIPSGTASSQTGQGLPHENMSPYRTLNFIIALEGIFPAQG